MLLIVDGDGQDLAAEADQSVNDDRLYEPREDHEELDERKLVSPDEAAVC
jgi:hypothetical protein